MKYVTNFSEPTDYAIANGVIVDRSNGNCRWWLRSPGYAQSLAAYIGSTGGLGIDGDVVNDSNAVRPVMWIDLTQTHKLLQ